MVSTIEAKVDTLLRQRKDPLCLRIGVAGGSGSGKSMICDLIRKGLHPCPTEVIALDRFFKPIDQLPRYYSNYHQNNQPDFNTPGSLLVESMVAYCRDRTVADIALLDGHLALYYPAMRELMDIKCFVATDLAEMLERRTARNLAVGYGGDRANILAYNQECVIPRHQEFIQPTQAFADFVIQNNRSDTLERDAFISILCSKIRSQQVEASVADAPSYAS